MSHSAENDRPRKEWISDREYVIYDEPAAVENDPRVPVLAALLEADFGWAVDAGWTATAESMLAKMDAATRDIPPGETDN